MRHFLLFISFCILAYATPADVALMLKSAKESFGAQESVNAQREAIFLRDAQEQKQLFEDVKTEVQKLKAQSVELNAVIDANEKTLAEAEKKLTIRSGNLGELYGVLRQSAGDMAAQLAISPTTQDSARVLFLKELSKTKKLPNSEELSKFWYIMLEELTLQGYIGKKNLNFINAEGKTLQKEVQTAGLFSAVTEEGFAKYIPDAHMFATLSKQPSSSYTSVALDGFHSSQALYETIIDPTRGQLLSLYTEAPSLEDRVHQGATIGYIILALGALGLLYALFLALKLLYIHFSIETKKGHSFVVDLQRAYAEIQNQTLEHVELALQERLATFKQKTDSGLTLLKLLAAVAPLLGLLGTVTGMIETFSAITLFGTGDPKLMAGGISQALVTTVEGLVVAIPLLFAYTLLSSKAKRIMENTESIALKLLANHQAN